MFKGNWLRFHRRKQHQKIRQRAEQERRTQSFWKKSLCHPDPLTRATYWIAVFTAFSAIGAGLSGFAAALQGFVLVQSDRASVSASGFHFESGLQIGQPIILSFNLNNNGKSQAELHDINVTIRPNLKYPLVYDPLTQVSGDAIPAGGTTRNIFQANTMDGHPRKFSEADLSNINEGHAAFFVYGYIEYEDKYSLFESRRTYFCYKYLPTWSKPNQSAFGGCPIER